MDDFSLLLPEGILDESGLFLEEPLAEEVWSLSGTPTGLSVSSTPGVIREIFDDDDGEEDREMNKRTKKSKSGASKYEEDDGTPPVSAGAAAATSAGGSEDEKAKKRRMQIAAASRNSRARRKQELDDLRDENKRLREERSQFLTKIGNLQMKVEHMRERGSTDMRVENELLRAQLEEHKRFVSCFKRLCDGAPTSLVARHQIYKQGSDSAQAHVLGLISQSLADEWKECLIPDDADIPFSNFSMFYKQKQDFGSSNRQRLNVRVDVTFPGMDATQVSDFFWTSFSTTDKVKRLFSLDGVEISQRFSDEMPDEDTKTLYYREQWEDKKDQDWVMICNRKRKELASSTLTVPCSHVSSTNNSRVLAIVLALATSQHSAVVEETPGVNRITSLFVQGAVTWNVAGDARLCVVFSLPDDVKMKAVEKLEDVVDLEGKLSPKFAEVLRSFREMMGETNQEVLL